MSGKFVRASKYRHVFAQSSKKELCYENLKITKNAWDSNIIKSNGKYLSVNWDASGGGAFAVIPTNEVGKAPDQVPLFRGHTAPVLDTDFNPFDHKSLISASDDGKIAVWEIPENYSFHNHLDENDEVKDIEPVRKLTGHTRKVGHLKFHPIAKNVFASSSNDYSVKIWNLETGKDEITLQHKDLITSFAFNYNGSLMVTCSRDKKIRIWDIRAGKIIAEGMGHTGAKSVRVTWLGNSNRILTTGFSRLSDRQIGIWNTEDIAAGPIGGFYVIDSSSGILIPVYDESTSILYVAGKGDGNIRYYEYESDELHELSEYQSTDAQRGFAVAPKYTVNIRENEITKAFKTVADSYIEPISFIVPRRSEMFQHDIYPDAASDKPALTAEEWFAGKNASGPILVSMEDLYEGAEPTFKENESVVFQHVTESISPKKEQKEPVATKVESKSIITPVQTYTKPNSKVDDLLNRPEVNKLIKKASDLDEDNDINETNDTWGEEDIPKKAESVPKEAPKIQKESAKPEIKQSEAEPSKVVEKLTKEIPAHEDTKDAVKDADSKKDSSPSKIPLATSTPSSVTTTTATKGPATLKGTVDKLASLVDKLETQISKLTEANAEKDEKLILLESKINELISK